MSLIAIGQMVLSLILIALILLQERDSGTSGLLGGGEGSFYQRRRGLERVIFLSTIIGIVLFAALSLLHLVVQ